VMIAMAMSCNPKLILADEITTALDVTIQAQILDLVGNLARESGTGFLLITHDLGIVAGMTQRVHVMYAGRIVEKATTQDLFARPRMPYTWGLLRSIPSLRQGPRKRLAQIEGRPPDLKSVPPGCRFQPRCPYRRQICAEKEPGLIAAAGGGPGQEVRCWGTQDVPGGGWLIDTDWRVDEGDPAVLAQIKQEAAAAVPGEAASGARDASPGGSQ
jgi:oligopeptide transport system ATP-binding protein